jgi:hypothetical protein
VLSAVLGEPRGAVQDQGGSDPVSDAADDSEGLLQVLLSSLGSAEVHVQGLTYPRGNMVGSLIVTHLPTFVPRTPATVST